MAFFQIEYSSDVLGQYRQVDVIYPDRDQIAERESDTDIPVLYLLHGAPLCPAGVLGPPPLPSGGSGACHSVSPAVEEGGRAVSGGCYPRLRGLLRPRPLAEQHPHSG